MPVNTAYITHHISISIMSSISFTMVSSKFFPFLLFLLLNKLATAEEDSSGFHGYERDTLLSLKASFNSSFLDGNWTGIMCYMNETTYWHGIRCLNGRVTGIILESMGLTGEIKVDALVNLTQLSILSLKNNLIYGTLIEFGNNQNLKKMDLSDNRFLGEIPFSLVYLNSLESLLLQGNNLTGSIPGFNQSNLKTFNVSQNNLSGAIPNTNTLQSFTFSSYFGNEKLCGTPTLSICSFRNSLSESSISQEENSDNHSKSSLLIPIVVVVNVIVLVVIIFLLIIYYKKYKKLKRETEARSLFPKGGERDSTTVERSLEQRHSEGDKGTFVLMENNGPRFELDDLGLGGRGSRDRVPFRWSSRLAAARSVGRAMEHLHRKTRSNSSAPHGNLKSSNVLLNENEDILVSDYGLTSLIAPPIAAQRMVSYKTPEYQSHNLISKSSDVWSYGCLLLELLTGKIPAISAPPGIDGIDLCGWVHRAVREEWTAELFDPEIAVQKGANQGMLRLMQIAIRCCEKSPEKRPNFSQVLREVEAVKVVFDPDDGELSYSSLDPSVTDDSLPAAASMVIADR